MALFNAMFQKNHKSVSLNLKTDTFKIGQCDYDKEGLLL